MTLFSIFNGFVILFLFKFSRQVLSATGSAITQEGMTPPSESYVVVVDAGSTGSRGFVFKFSLNKDAERVVTSKKLLKVTPGVSSFASNTSGITEYFVPLIFDAAKAVPEQLHKSTPVFVKGTAGMRLLTQKEQQNIWKSLVHGLSSHPNVTFKIQSSNFGTIDGGAEAYYAALTSNYIAGSIDANLRRIEGKNMVGALDMGGSSTQLIFHTFTKPGQSVRKSDFWYHSWINYGVEVVREKVYARLVEDHHADRRNSNVSSSSNTPTTTSSTINNPCSFIGHELVYDSGVVLRGSGDAKACVARIKNVVWEDPAKCKEGSPCFVDNVKHPPLSGHFYGMSVYFYAMDCIRKLGPNKLPTWPNPTIDELEVATQQFCALSWREAQRTMLPNKHPYTRDNQIVNRCMEGLYMTTLLEHGFGFKGTARNITLALDIKGNEVEWSLGFALNYGASRAVSRKDGVVGGNGIANGFLVKASRSISQLPQRILSSISLPFQWISQNLGGGKLKELQSELQALQQVLETTKVMLDGKDQTIESLTAQLANFERQMNLNKGAASEQERKLKVEMQKQKDQSDLLQREIVQFNDRVRLCEAESSKLKMDKSLAENASEKQKGELLTLQELLRKEKERASISLSTAEGKLSNAEKKLGDMKKETEKLRGELEKTNNDLKECNRKLLSTPPAPQQPQQQQQQQVEIMQEQVPRVHES